MADRKYDFYGSAAYDVRTTAVPRPRPARLPEEKPLPKAKQAPKPRLAIAPLAVVGLIVVGVLLMMVVYSYVQLYEATDRIGELSKDLASAQVATEKIRSTYESRIDLAQVEARAKELGMTQPSARQTVYLNIAGADHAEVLQVDQRGFLEKAWDAVSDSFNGVLEYFH
ncbi:MAG: hypothetical protein J5789_00995 [Oscillospiraceae bacterium]|nr:hypothetical protein [Oscillospiraceae bacterium]